MRDAETSYGAATEADMPAVERVLADAFATSPDGARAWLAVAGHDLVRVLRRGGDVVAAALVIPMGQFFGGRSVPMVGLAGVAVTPAARGGGTSGVGGALMRAVLDEVRGTGQPLVTLYASTMSFYRRFGFEMAGLYQVWEAPMASLGRGGGVPPTVRRYREEDDEAMRACYRRIAAHRNGACDRGDYLWDRVRSHRGEPATGFVVEGDGAADGGIDGYVWLRQLPGQSQMDRFLLEVRDAEAATPEAAQAIVALLSGYGSICDRMRSQGTPTHPMLLAMREHQLACGTMEHWLLRLLDVRGALAARGYRGGAAGALPLAVEDEADASNGGAMTLEVSDGSGAVREGASGDVLRITARSLAALYAGAVSAFELRTWGGAWGSDGACAVADAIFGDGPSTMGEAF